LQITNNGQQTTGGITSGLQLQLPALFAKRQGVSGESSDLHNHHNHHNNHGGHHGGHQNRLLLAGAPNNQQPGDISLLVTSHDKDFRYVFFTPKIQIRKLFFWRQISFISCARKNRNIRPTWRLNELSIQRYNKS
jgi:hypothetical protein